MDWHFVLNWLEDTGLEAEEVYLAVREYMMRKEYTDWRYTPENQLEFQFG